MQLEVDIEFNQLLKLVKQLPEKQWERLKNAVEEEKTNAVVNPDLEAFLLSAPTFTKKQLDEIAKTRKAISQWRTK